uniref:GNAT family N-acetyltransferase n=1 Tax=Roseihalotalea indica TaxID=2867963 RepID=A0AA49GRS1_9BACT|nr:GNAT family N-acetyltransferase [Tunicatimonas sp. TK19036]
MELIKPTLAYGASFVDAMEELRERKEDGFFRALGSPRTVAQYIRMINNHANNRELPLGWIPYSTFWLVDEEEFIGELHFRHLLTDYLKNYGGHVGYTIRPSKRGKGYGKHQLALALPEMKQFGVDRVLITCDETNLASKKIIEANGGLFEKANAQGKNMPKKLLYWITL